MQGNNKADTLAGTAADMHGTPLAKAKAITDKPDKPVVIQNRIVVVTNLLPQKEHNKTGRMQTCS